MASSYAAEALRLLFFRPLAVPVYSFGAKKRASCTILVSLYSLVSICFSGERKNNKRESEKTALFFLYFLESVMI